MNRRLLAAALGTALLGAAAATALANSPMHPEIVLLDDAGTPVLESGRPVSARRTCAKCHDVAFIESHDAHRGHMGPRDACDPSLRGADWAAEVAGIGTPVVSDGRSVPPRLSCATCHDAEFLSRDPSASRGDPGVSRRPSPDAHCFACHLPEPSEEDRRAAFCAGRADWATTASLSRTGLVTAGDDGTWRYAREKFAADGTVPRGVLRLSDPTTATCGTCHLEASGPFAGRDARGTWSPTDRRGGGLVFSGDKIASSGLNLAGKDARTDPWDVHAARLVGCSDCHAARNHPARAGGGRERPAHLSFDARTPDLGEYLKTPDHGLLGGKGAALRCESCHDVEAGHSEWLPHVRMHFRALACEACHVPHVPTAAPLERDRTAPRGERDDVVSWRGAEGDPTDPATLLVGYEPVLLPREEEGGGTRLAPYTLTTTWRRGDGGAVEGVVEPTPLSHGIVGGERATRRCESCHGDDSRLTRPFVVATRVPADATARLAPTKGVRWSGILAPGADGGLAYVPSTSAAGLHVLGIEKRAGLDLAGGILALGTLLGVLGHGAMRVLAARRRKEA